MQVTAQMVKELRERTGAGMMDCKKALAETDGDMEKAIDLLRKKGLAAAAKKAGRVAAEGAVGSYIHAGGKIGVLVEVNCETDFVARTDEFQELVKDIAMHIAAAEPRFVAREEVTAEVLEREREIFREQARGDGQAGERGREDRRRQGREVLRRDGAARAAVREEPGPDGRPAGQREGRQDRREHPGAPLRRASSSARGSRRRATDFAAEVLAQAGQAG